MPCTGRYTGLLGRDPVTPFPVIVCLRVCHHPVPQASKVDSSALSMWLCSIQARLDQQEKEKADLVNDFSNRLKQYRNMNADLKQGSGKRDQESKVLKQTFEQYKVEAANKLKVTPSINCNGDHLLYSRNPEPAYVWAALKSDILMYSTRHIAAAFQCSLHQAIANAGCSLSISCIS